MQVALEAASLPGASSARGRAAVGRVAGLPGAVSTAAGRSKLTSPAGCGGGRPSHGNLTSQPAPSATQAGGRPSPASPAPPGSGGRGPRSALEREGPWPRPAPGLWASRRALLAASPFYPPTQNPSDQKPYPPKEKVTGPSEPGCVGALPILTKLTGFGSYLLTSVTLAYLDGDNNRVVVEMII